MSSPTWSVTAWMFTPRRLALPGLTFMVADLVGLGDGAVHQDVLGTRPTQGLRQGHCLKASPAIHRRPSPDR